jgi:hypothetical protein
MTTNELRAPRRATPILASVFSLSLILAVGCDDGVTSPSDGSVAAGDGSTGGADGGATLLTGCASATTHIDKVVCVANALLETLSTSELASVQLAFTDNVSRTKWSNLPGVTRAGLKLGGLSNAASKTAALSLMATVLSDAGNTDLVGVLNADDYLGSQSSGGGGGGQYSSSNYSIAIFGTPSETGNWAITFGGHHLAYNVTYLAGVGYPVPNHIGVEPKASFTINGATYAPLVDEGDAMLAIFKSLSSTDLATAYLTGQTFADVLIGPVEYGTGTAAAAKAKFPAGTNRTGVVVATLSATQQALVSSAIAQWVSDYDPAISTSLLAEYTSAAAFADTYVAWGGTQASGVDPDVNGTYLRVDGPRLWVEVSCQAGVVIQGKTHYHTIFRDKQFDYGGTL